MNLICITKMKQLLILLLLGTIVGCTIMDRSQCKNGASSIEQVSPLVFFDKSVGRYVFIGDITKGNDSYYEQLSVDIENAILDSLEQYANIEGKRFKVVYIRGFREGIDSLEVVDSLEVGDTCQIMTVGGYLNKNGYEGQDITLTNTGAMGAGAECNLVVTGPINAFFYSVYQTFVIDHKADVVALTGTDTNYIGTYYYIGSTSDVRFGYTNSEFQSNKVWTCHYTCWYQQFGYHSND